MINVRPQFDFLCPVRTIGGVRVKDKRYEFRTTRHYMSMLDVLAFRERLTRPEMLHKLIEAEARRKKVWRSKQ